MHTLTEDANHCCKIRWNKAARQEKLTGITEWECPACGCTYKPRAIGPFTFWEYEAWVTLG